MKNQRIAIPLLGLAIASTAVLLPATSAAQTATVSFWDAADFRFWSFVPYWASQSQVQSFSSDRVYDHVSDVIYFSGVRPTETGGLSYHKDASQHLATLRSHAATHGFRFHMSMFDVDPGKTVDAVWTSMTSNPVYRANFVANVGNLMAQNNMSGFNLDWERPNTVTKWANYTQLAKDLKAAMPDKEISVDDYGFTDSQWDNSSVFDARTYDQLFIMGYHYGASSNAGFANGKLALTAQGTDKAFKDEQLVIGIGTWGDPPSGSIRTMKQIAAANPNLPYDQGIWTEGSNTWTIESRQQVREKMQLALDRNMAGAMAWTLHYDATNKLSLHRVAHHYVAFKRAVPDLNLDGRVDTSDANMLADNIGTVPGWTGTNTAARFDDFYLSENWERGDRDGNGFVNQQDADWLAARFDTLGVSLPDRLPYTGSFEVFEGAIGLNGRWKAGRNASGQLTETGNFAQHAPGSMTFNGVGIGATCYNNLSITIRNQNAAEAYDSINTAPRTLRAEVAAPIHLSQNQATYITFLVRQNSNPLLGTHASSPSRILKLELLDSAGQPQIDFAFFGQQQQFGIRSASDSGMPDATSAGFGNDQPHLFIAKIEGNGLGANEIQASLFAPGSFVGDFTAPSFPWMLSTTSTVGFDPTITHVQFNSLFEGNFTVSSVTVGSAIAFFGRMGAESDFNADGHVDESDFAIWQAGFGGIAQLSRSHGDADNDGDVDGHDLLTWQQQLRTTQGSNTLQSAVPEPAAWTCVAAVSIALWVRTRPSRPASTRR